MAYINCHVLYRSHKQEAPGTNPVPVTLPTSFEASLRNQTMKKESYALTNQFGMNGEPIKNPNGVEMKMGGARGKSVEVKPCDAGVCQVSWKPDRPASTDKIKQ